MTDNTAALITHYRWMAHYNRWMNQRLYASASELDDAARKQDRGAFFGSIHNTLNHLVLADKVWLRRFAQQGHSFKALRPEILEAAAFTGLDQVLFDDYMALREHRAAMDLAIEAWAAELTPEFAGLTMHYASTKGVPREHAAWIAISHFFNHQTHHRGQVTALLMQAGVDPGVTDLIALAS